MNPVKYDIFKDGKYIGEYAATDFAKQIGINVKIIYIYADKAIRYKGYSFRRKERFCGEMSIDEIKFEWDKWRKVLNPNAKD